jgi:ribosomal protein S5
MRGSMPLMELAEAFGLDGITMKIHKSQNVHNIMKAFVKGVTSVHPPEFTARKLGKRLLDTNKIWNPARGTNSSTFYNFRRR